MSTPPLRDVALVWFEEAEEAVARVVAVVLEKITPRRRVFTVGWDELQAAGLERVLSVRGMNEGLLVAFLGKNESDADVWSAIGPVQRFSVIALVRDDRPALRGPGGEVTTTRYDHWSDALTAVRTRLSDLERRPGEDAGVDLASALEILLHGLPSPSAPAPSMPAPSPSPLVDDADADDAESAVPIVSPAPTSPASPAASISGLLAGILGSLMGRREHSDDRRPTIPGVDPADEAVAVATVQIGASAPRRASPGTEFTARFVAHTPEAQTAMASTLASLSPASTSHLDVKRCQWARGTSVLVTLRARGLTVEPPSRTFTWDGHHNIVEFDVSVPPEVAPGTAVLKFDAAIDGFVVAPVRLDLEIVTAGAAGHLPVQASATGMAARTAFASYSSVDRQRVLDRVAAVRISAGLDVFLDCLSLHPGDAWRSRLEAEIEARDLFLLFWSESAAASEYVSWEWRKALSSRGKEAIQLHPLDVGVSPPAELADLHFGDVLMLARRAERAAP